MATRVEQSSGRQRRQLAMTAHHMTGQTSLGKVPEQDEKKKRKPHPDAEYDAFDAGDFMQAWASNVIGGELVPVITEWSKHALPDSRVPWLGTKYGKTV